MNCASSRELLGAYFDGELDPSLHAEMHNHLAACDACTGAFASLQEQQADIRSTAPHYEIPPALVASVRAAWRAEAANEIRTSSKAVRSWGWAAMAASLLLCVSVGWNFVLLRSRPARQEVLAEDLLSSHVRSLIGTHLFDVPSSDQHTVKPWFNGKLNYSPDVTDLAARGFPLLGGRIEYIANRAVAALVFGRRKHVINLFTWPATEGPATSRWSRQGYNLVHWTKGDVGYWAISDISVEELAHFRDLYRTAP